MVNWPEPLTIPESVRKLKQKFVQSLADDPKIEKERKLNYIVAVSSGKAVTEEIPKQIGRRAGWASQQGANFVELLIENPAQLIMDQDMLVNLADQLELHYNIHSSTSLAYGMAYRVGRGNGYDRAHEYSVKLLKSIKRFRTALEQRGMPDDGIPRLYAVNAHMAVAEMPAQQERLATDISVDPFGDELEDSRIFEVKEARLGIFKHFVWDVLGIKNDINDFARILNLFEETRDLQDFIQAEIVDLLEEEGYISDEFLAFINQVHVNPDVLGGRFQFSIAQQYDVPETVEALKRHVNGQGLAQQLATLTPRDGIREQINDETWASYLEQLEDQGVTVPETRALDLTLPASSGGWDRIVTIAQDNMLQEGSAAFEELERLLGAEDPFTEEQATEAMQNIARMRMLHDDFNKESSIFRYIIPLWMPFAKQEQVQQIWEGITGKTVEDHEELIHWLYDPYEKGGEGGVMELSRHEENVLAAGTGAYVWGHFTHTPPGHTETLLELIEKADIFWSFESHMAGDVENARIWKPKDRVEVVKAINSTPITYTNEEGKEVTKPIPRTRVTIDMEHIATQKVDPMWVVDPDEEGLAEGYKGLEDGDGKYIMINHITHPYIGEGGHHHGPIRRGDIIVYRYLHALISKGMTTDPEYPAVVMYEIGGEKSETLYMLRLILNMIEHGIGPEELEGDAATEIIVKDEPEDLREYLIQEFFGVTDTEVQHEWQEIFEHALDPLDELLQVPEGSHTWMGRAATEAGTRPEEWQGEEYQ